MTSQDAGGGFPSTPGREPSAWRLALIALVATCALWPLFKYHVGPDNELRVCSSRVREPLTGSAVFQRPGHGPQALTLPLSSLWSYRGDGLPEGIQELHIALPRRALWAEVTLHGLQQQVMQVSWVSTRVPVGFRNTPSLSFEAEALGNGSVRVRVPHLQPSFWAPDAADALFLGGTWLLLWLVLEAKWGRGRVAVFARHRAGWAKYALPLALAWGTWWLAFFPGLVSFDPLSQWQQFMEGSFSNWHPAFHTWWLVAFTYPFKSMGTLTGFQVLFLAMAMGKVLEELGHWRVPAWARWGVVSWMGLSPAVGINAIAAWKDMPFALMCVVSALLMLRLARTRDASPGSAVRLALCVACLGLLRHNGMLVAGPLLLTGLGWMKDRRARVLLVSLGMGLIVLVRGPLFTLAKVTPVPATLTQVLTLHRLGVVATSPDVTPEEVRVLESLMPLEEWRSRYRCSGVGAIVLSPTGVATERVEGRGLELAGVVARFALRHPEALLDQWLCVTRYVWGYEPALYKGPFNGEGQTVDPNGYFFATRSWLPVAQRAYESFYFATSSGPPWLNLLFWQPSPSVYLLLVGLLVLRVRQRGWLPVLVFQAALINNAGWLVLSPNPDLRFLFPTLLTAPLVLAWACASRMRVAGARDVGADGGGGPAVQVTASFGARSYSGVA